MSLATVHHLPTHTAVDTATPGALATWNGCLYARGGPGWIVIAGSPHGPTYTQWIDELPADAIHIREGL